MARLAPVHGFAAETGAAAVIFTAAIIFHRFPINNKFNIVKYFISSYNILQRNICQILYYY